MSSMMTAAQAFHRFLSAHLIDPAKVKFVVRADDEATADRLRYALEKDLGPLGIEYPGEPLGPLKGLQIHGVKFSFTTLDGSVVTDRPR
jgi:hypothetical protein